MKPIVAYNCERSGDFRTDCLSISKEWMSTSCQLKVELNTSYGDGDVFQDGPLSISPPPSPSTQLPARLGILPDAVAGWETRGLSQLLLHMLCILEMG